MEDDKAKPDKGVYKPKPKSATKRSKSRSKKRHAPKKPILFEKIEDITRKKQIAKQEKAAQEKREKAKAKQADLELAKAKEELAQLEKSAINTTKKMIQFTTINTLEAEDSSALQRHHRKDIKKSRKISKSPSSKYILLNEDGKSKCTVPNIPNCIPLIHDDDEDNTGIYSLDALFDPSVPKLQLDQDVQNAELLTKDPSVIKLIEDKQQDVQNANLAKDKKTSKKLVEMSLENVENILPPFENNIEYALARETKKLIDEEIEREKEFGRSLAAEFLQRTPSQPFTFEQNETLEDEINKLKQNLAELRKTSKENKKQMRTLTKENQNVTAELNSWKLKIRNMTKETEAEKQATLEKEKRVLDKYNRTTKKLLDENKALYKRIQDLKELMDIEDKEILNLKCRGCDENTETFMKKFQETHELWQTKTALVEKIEEEIKELEQVVAKLNEGIASQCNRLNELKDEALQLLNFKYPKRKDIAPKMKTRYLITPDPKYMYAASSKSSNSYEYLGDNLDVQY